MMDHKTETTQGTSKKAWLKWFLIFLVCTLIGLTNFLRFVTNKIAEGETPKIKFYFIMESTGAYTFFLLIPFLLWFFKKYPLKRGHLLTGIPLYMLASMIMGASHTSLMFLSRKLIYFIFNLGVYDYGDFGVRLLMEYNHQAITFWLIYGFVLFNRHTQKRQKEKIKLVELEEKLTKARLESLKMQLNPHFLFNTMNMISATMYEDVNKADKMITLLSDLLRITLKKNDKQTYKLGEEIKTLGKYVGILKARFDQRLSVKFQIEKEAEKAIIPEFILQPLLENAIQYSMRKSDRVQVRVQARKIRDRLMLIVEDNGPGISQDLGILLNKGLGLSNTWERLQKSFPENFKFELNNHQGNGLQVLIQIPFSMRR